MVERLNRNLEEHICKVNDNSQRDWDTNFPLFLMVYHATVHETTGFTPARLICEKDLVFGSLPTQERDVTNYALH